MRIVILLLFLSSLSYTQDMNNSFVTSKFRYGKPEELPSQWGSTLYAKINSGDLYRSIFIVSRDSLKTLSHLWSIINEREGYQVSPVVFSSLDKKESTIILITEDLDEISPLKLIFNIEKSELNYRWINEKTNEYTNPSIIKENALKPGKAFPIIEIQTKQGKWSNSNKNKIIVINWWSTACLPCREEIPGLNKLVEKYKGSDIEFISIVNDKKNLPKFLKTYKFDYQQGYSDTDLSLLFGASYPRHMIIDRSGKIIYNKTGGSEDIYIKLDNVIKTLL